MQKALSSFKESLTPISHINFKNRHPLKINLQKSFVQRYYGILNSFKNWGTVAQMAEKATRDCKVLGSFPAWIRWDLASIWFATPALDIYTQDNSLPNSLNNNQYSFFTALRLTRGKNIRRCIDSNRGIFSPSLFSLMCLTTRPLGFTCFKNYSPRTTFFWTLKNTISKIVS